MGNIGKIFSVEQIRKADLYTIATEPIASVDLMERAATACVNWITRHYTNTFSFVIFCGPGNNGGDGLAIARLLIEKKYKVAVYNITGSAKNTDDFRVNQERMVTMAPTVFHSLNTVAGIPDLPEATVIIDAIFGTGLSKPITGFAAELIAAINHSKAAVISIDMPSGLMADQHSDPATPIVKAAVTLSFQFPKLAFFFAENVLYAGNWQILDIGLNKKFIEEEPVGTYYLTEAYIKTLVKPRAKFSHKGSFGHALLISGSAGKMGAAVLATAACLRSGVGLLTVHVPACGYEILQTTHAEAMVSVDSGQNCIKDAIPTNTFSAVGIGPGIGTDPATEQTLMQLARSTTTPLVLDADALNIISRYQDGLTLLPPNSILTPHPKEFERLAGKTANDFERHETQKAFSQKYKVYVVLKGAYSCITTPAGEAYFNTTGNPGMAKGGSGDVLTGILTGLLAQGYPQKEACLLGVYLHGRSGDLAKKTFGEISMLAGDLICYLPEAFISVT